MQKQEKKNWLEMMLRKQKGTRPQQFFFEDLYQTKGHGIFKMGSEQLDLCQNNNFGSMMQDARMQTHDWSRNAVGKSDEDLNEGSIRRKIEQIRIYTEKKFQKVELTDLGQMQWFISVIPTIWEVEIGRNHNLRSSWAET